MKRLEKGTYRWPAPGAARVEWTAAELAAVLGGIDLGQARRRPRFTPEPRRILDGSREQASRPSSPIPV